MRTLFLSAKKSFCSAKTVIKLWCVLASASPLAAQVYFTESFDQSSVFGPTSGYTRSSLAGNPYAPNTIPPLHVNQGDTALMYSSVSFTHVQTFAPATYNNVRIDGYLALGDRWQSGNTMAGLVLGATSNASYYDAAYINQDGQLSIVSFVNGVGQFAWQPIVTIPEFDPLHEDYHLTFEKQGAQVTASVAREKVVDGVRVEEFIGAISGTDTALGAGRVGLYSFLGLSSDGHVFFDDITVSQVPEASTAALALAGVVLSACARRRSRPRLNRGT